MKDSTPRSDFTRQSQPATTEHLMVEYATTYNMNVTPEESERQLRGVYGGDRLPGTESRRRSQMGETTEPEPRTCAQCGARLVWRFRFCTQWCWVAFQDENAVAPGSPEMVQEMHEALDRLREAIE